MNETDYVLLYRIADAYYCQGQTQDQIAKRENISRPHVSRLLAKARECGIVTIQVQFPEHVRQHFLSEQLCSALKLRKVILSVPTQETDSRSISQAIAQAAAESLPDLLESSLNIGVGWGYTLYKTSKLLPTTTATKAQSFVPLVGVTGEDTPFFQTNVIVNRFAERLGGSSKFTNIPAIRESRVEMDEFAKGGYLRLRRQWARLDTAIIGLGDCPGIGLTLLPVGNQEYRKIVEQSGAVGDILAHFFYRDGSILDTSAHFQQNSLSPHSIRNIETVICIAGGPKKIESLLAAAQNRFYNILITDPQTAQAMLDRI